MDHLAGFLLDHLAIVSGSSHLMAEVAIGAQSTAERILGGCSEERQEARGCAEFIARLAEANRRSVEANRDTILAVLAVVEAQFTAALVLGELGRVSPEAAERVRRRLAAWRQDVDQRIVATSQPRPAGDRG